MSETAGERTLAPTPKRLRDAARDGDVLRSRDLSVAAATLAGAAVLRFGGPWLLGGLSRAMRAGLVWDARAIDGFDPGRLLIALGVALLPPVLAIGAAMSGAALLAQLGPASGGRFVGGNLMPKFGRLNPLAGLGRMAGAQAWIELGKGLAKLLLLGTIAYAWSRGRLARLIALGAAPLSAQLAAGWEAITTLLFLLAGGLVAIAMVDFPIQWLRRRRRLMMSHQQARDETKETDGAPERRAAIRRRQRQVAMSGVAAAMRKAQFVLTNPTHFAVAMAYDATIAPAPIVLAKGRGEKALAMRELAAEHGVPCLEYPALARSVYYTTQERQVIREELYAAVAGVLAFVLSLRRGEDRAAPRIEVPVALRFDAEGRLE